MYPAQVNSPQTELSAAITNAVTTISVLNASVLPAAPNLVVIGSDETAETVLYTGKSGNDLTGCTRGFQGTAKAWGAGVKVARNFTAYDYDSLRTNVMDNQSFLSQQPPVTADLVPGIQSVTVPRDTPYNVLNIRGRTLVNITGRDGGCESLAPFAITGTAALSNTQKRSGTNSIKLTANNSHSLVSKKYNFKLDTTKQYIVGAWAYIESFTSGGFGIRMFDYDGLTSRYQASVSSSVIGSWQFIYVKIPVGNTIVGDGFTMYAGTTGQSTGVVYIDEIRLYELSTADYNAIGTTLTTGAQIDAFIPYVDDIKPVYAPFVYKYGKNLLPPFTEWTLHANAVVTEPYKLTLNATTTGQSSSVTVDVIEGVTYTISLSNVMTGQRLIIRKENSSGSIVVNNLSVGSVTFTVDATYNKKAYIYTYNDTSTGTLILDRPQLELGTVATSFVQRNDDYLFFPNLSLHANVDGTVYDQLYVDGNGQYRKLARFRETVLGGSLAWTFSADNTGYKELYVESFYTSDSSLIYGTKYDGKILKHAPVANSATDQVDFNSSGRLYITVSDTDSGWGESYTPSAAEIQAYFNGWKMSSTNTASPAPYTGTGNKYWYGIQDTPTGSASYTAANATPTTQNAAAGSYRLVYQLAKAEDEPADSEGSVTWHEGANQTEVGCGVIVRERANPVKDLSGIWNINNAANFPASATKYRVNRFFAVYRNREKDIWAQGAGIAQKQVGPFDESAVYEVTYLALDTYALGIVPQSISGEYAPNMRGTVDGMARRQAEVVTRLTVLERSTPNKAQPQWIAPTLLNGFGLHNSIAAGYRKEESRLVRLRGELSGNGTNGGIVFRLPAGYRPNADYNFSTIASSVNAGVGGTGEAFVTVKANGEVSVTITSDIIQWISINQIIFEAAQ